MAYRSKQRRTERVKKQVGKDKPNDNRFWLSDEPHKVVFDDGKRIARLTRGQRTQDLYHACLYDDAELASLVQGAGAIGQFTPQTLSSNIVKRQVDTFTSHAAKNRPVPMGLTTGGNYSQQRRAKSLSKFFEGILDNIDFWTTRENRLRDGAIWGSGMAYNYRVGDQQFHDRIFPWEVEVDPREAMYGKPRTFRFKRFVDRLWLTERFPAFAEQIAEADSKTDDEQWELGWDETCDLVLLRGIWHLASTEGSKDGHFALCISNATLEMKEYTRPYPPFSKFDFLPSLMGWRGQGMVRQLTGLQYEVNAIGMRLQESGYMTGTYVLLEDGSEVEVDTLDNGTLSIVRYRGAKPDWVTPAAWHPAIFDYYLKLRGEFPAEESRISQLSTRGEIPAGIESGRAIRTYHDIETEGFVPQGRADERDVIATCWQHFDLAEEIYAERGEKKDKRVPYKVNVEMRKHGRTTFEPVDYGEVRLDRKAFTLRVFPTNFLRGTPEDQMAAVREMIDSGFLSQDEAISLLDFPDLQRVLNLRGAARRNIERLLEKYREADDVDAEGLYEFPLPAWNLELCKALALMAYLEAKLDGVPEENLKLIMKFATDAQQELDAAEAESQAGAAAAQVDMNTDPSQLPPGGPVPDPGAQYAPPDAQLMPGNAVAPTAIAALPTG